MGQFCWNGEGCDVLFRRRAKIGAPGFDFDAVTGAGDQLPVGVGKQKEAEAKENDHGRYCNNAKEDEVEQGASDTRPRCPRALTRGIGERVRRFGGL
jgi:hypothetical protein